MTLREAREIVVGFCPEGTSVCIEAQAWSHDSGNEYTLFKASILPGISGEACTNFMSSTIESAIAKCREALGLSEESDVECEAEGG
jgi:hypothetical protein